MIQEMVDIIRRFCSYGIQCKDQERYTHNWVKPLPQFQLVYNTNQTSTTGKLPSLVEKRWNALMPVYHLKKSLLTTNPASKDFHDMWKRAFDTAERCIAEAKEYKKQRYEKTHKEPQFREGDQVLESTFNFNNIKGPKNMRASFV
ncbi:hypothetical protein O181_131342 [Austropuccinia psidii MF-1]|uniref:Uncharacterized protein n=1 Tax=Austropuccinia psidii MF-1 TaxID=1389203 RepID=A0A9Q3L2V5_9BASI|nr:hypothetical protein [Austropuccinia psidii MF-1]